MSNPMDSVRGSRRGLLRAATAVGLGAAFTGTAEILLSSSVSAHGSPYSQGNWRYCRNCKGLFYNGDGGVRGICTASTNGHDPSLSYTHYYLDADFPQWDDYQLGWRHCINCQGLAYGVSPAGLCPAGNRHNHTGSHNYQIKYGDYYLTPPEQAGWMHCKRCQGLHYGPQITYSRCPAANRDGLPGNHHSPEGSYNYKLWYTP